MVIEVPYLSKRENIRCKDCSNSINNLEYTYYCPNGKTRKHPNGLDLCSECGSKRNEKRKENLKEKNETNGSVKTVSTLVNNNSNNINNNLLGFGMKGKILLYENLVKMAGKGIMKQKMKLKQIIDGYNGNNSWQGMIKYSQNKEDMLDKRGNVNLRQDSKKYLTFPNELGFDVKKLENLSMKDFYDSRVYLSNLMLVARSLDDKFHDIMKKDILKKDFNCVYHRGPLKRIQRCQEKAEVDYADKPYPNSAQLLGMFAIYIVEFVFFSII